MVSHFELLGRKRSYCVPTARRNTIFAYDPDDDSGERSSSIRVSRLFAKFAGVRG